MNRTFNQPPVVTVIGGGMITAIQLLPTLYHLQRIGRLGEIHICALQGRPLLAIQKDAALGKGFPGQTFVPHPDPAQGDLDKPYGDLYKQVVDAMPERNIVVVALPDAMHFDATMYALAHDQHVLSVKPLVLSHKQAEQIEQLAAQRGLLVGVEYHKRFDTRSLMARQEYRSGRLGQFRAGQAHLVEKYYYRHSNFQNWCTCENSDMFTYIGCHYVDLVAFITGLRPTGVSIYGLREKYPNGREGYLWTDARVLWENGAFLSVLNGLGYPDAGPGGNSQGMTLFCEGETDGTFLRHSDQYRGVVHSYTAAGGDPGDTIYAEPNPDYFRLVDQGDGGLTPCGYGHRSVEAIIEAIADVERQGGDDLALRGQAITKISQAGIIATPANSGYNELVIEAGRLSLANGGKLARIEYEPTPRVVLE